MQCSDEGFAAALAELAEKARSADAAERDAAVAALQTLKQRADYCVAVVQCAARRPSQLAIGLLSDVCRNVSALSAPAALELLEAVVRATAAPTLAFAERERFGRFLSELISKATPLGAERGRVLRESLLCEFGNALKGTPNALQLISLCLCTQKYFKSSNDLSFCISARNAFASPLFELNARFFADKMLGLSVSRQPELALLEAYRAFLKAVKALSAAAARTAALNGAAFLAPILALGVEALTLRTATDSLGTVWAANGDAQRFLCEIYYEGIRVSHNSVCAGEAKSAALTVSLLKLLIDNANCLPFALLHAQRNGKNFPLFALFIFAKAIPLFEFFDFFAREKHAILWNVALPLCVESAAGKSALFDAPNEFALEQFELHKQERVRSVRKAASELLQTLSAQIDGFLTLSATALLELLGDARDVPPSVFQNAAEGERTESALFALAALRARVDARGDLLAAVRRFLCERSAPFMRSADALVRIRFAVLLSRYWDTLTGAERDFQRTAIRWLVSETRGDGAAAAAAARCLGEVGGAATDVLAELFAEVSDFLVSALRGRPLSACVSFLIGFVAANRARYAAAPSEARALVAAIAAFIAENHEQPTQQNTVNSLWHTLNELISHGAFALAFAEPIADALRALLCVLSPSKSNWDEDLFECVYAFVSTMKRLPFSVGELTAAAARAQTTNDGRVSVLLRALSAAMLWRGDEMQSELAALVSIFERSLAATRQKAYLNESLVFLQLIAQNFAAKIDDSRFAYLFDCFRRCEQICETFEISEKEFLFENIVCVFFSFYIESPLRTRNVSPRGAADFLALVAPRLARFKTNYNAKLLQRFLVELGCELFAARDFDGAARVLDLLVPFLKYRELGALLDALGNAAPKGFAARVARMRATRAAIARLLELGDDPTLDEELSDEDFGDAADGVGLSRDEFEKSRTLQGVVAPPLAVDELARLRAAAAALFAAVPAAKEELLKRVGPLTAELLEEALFRLQYIGTTAPNGLAVIRSVLILKV